MRGRPRSGSCLSRWITILHYGISPRSNSRCAIQAHEKFWLPACRLFSLHQRVAGTYHREDASGSAYFFSAPFGGVPGFCGLLMS